jgi:hypothetical protein
MKADALLADLRARGVELVADGDRLRFRPVEAVSPDELNALRVFKPEILQRLADEHEVSLRVAAFQAQLDVWVAEGRIAVPILTLPDVDIRFGRCAGCGEPLDPDRAWRCDYCVTALHIVLDKLETSERHQS